MKSTIEIRGGLLARNTLLNFIGQVIPLAVGLVTIPYIVHGLGAERFGILSLAWVILGYFSLFDLGLGRATTKFVAEALGKGEVKEIPFIVWTSLISSLIFGVLGCIILIVVNFLLLHNFLKIPEYLIEESRVVFIVVATIIPMTILTRNLQGILEAMQRFDLINLINSISSALNFIIPVIVINLNLSFIWIFSLLMIKQFLHLFTILKFVLFLQPIIKVIKLKFIFFHRLLSFGSWLTLHYLSSSTMTILDRFLIGHIISLSAVAYYTIPADLISKLGIISSSITLTIFPAFSTLSLNRNELKKVYFQSLKFSLFILGILSIMISAFAKDILSLWIGPVIAQNSWLILEIFSISSFVGLMTHIPISLIQAIGRPDLIAKVVLIELPIYISLSYFFILKFGIVGSALAWLLMIIINAIIFFYMASTLSKISLNKLTENRIIHGVVLTITLICSLITINFFLKDFVRLLTSLLLSGISVALLWKWILNTDDRNMFLKGIRFLIFWVIKFIYSPICGTLYQFRNLIKRDKPFKIKINSYLCINLIPKGAEAKAYWTRARTEKNEINWVLERLSDGMIFFDIGSNVGIYSISVAKKYPKSRVYAFEPCKSTFKILLENIKINNVSNIIAENVALADYVGYAKLLINDQDRDGLNTIAKFAVHPDSKIIGAEDVRVITIDEYLKKTGIENVDLIKIDVEGAEYMVLKGAVELLSKANAPDILLEYPALTAQGFGYEPWEVIELLYKMNFRIYYLSGNKLKTYSNEKNISMLIASKKI